MNITFWDGVGRNFLNMECWGLYLMPLRRKKHVKNKQHFYFQDGKPVFNFGRITIWPMPLPKIMERHNLTDAACSIG